MSTQGLRAAMRDRGVLQAGFDLEEDGPVIAVSQTLGPNERALAASRLFGALPAQTLSQLAPCVVRRSFLRTERIFRAGELATGFHVILTGVIKIVRPIADGSEAIVGLFGPRESIGDPAVLERTPYPAEAIVCTETAEVLRVEAGAVLALAERSPEVARAMNRALLDHTRALQQKIGIMSAGSVPKRLATLLLTLAERFGDEDEDGALSIPVVLSRGELSCLIGARVETTIRAVRLWEREGVLATHGGGFCVRDVARLIAETRAHGGRDDA